MYRLALPLHRLALPLHRITIPINRLGIARGATTRNSSTLHWNRRQRFGCYSPQVTYNSLWLEVNADTNLTAIEKSDSVSAIASMGTQHAKRATSLWKRGHLFSGDVTSMHFELFVFPNPSQDFYTVRYVGSRAPELVIRVVDVFGREHIRFTKTEVRSGDEFIITNDNLSNGSYIVEVSNGVHYATQPVSVLR